MTWVDWKPGIPLTPGLRDHQTLLLCASGPYQPPPRAPEPALPSRGPGTCVPWEKAVSCPVWQRRGECGSRGSFWRGQDSSNAGSVRNTGISLPQPLWGSISYLVSANQRRKGSTQPTCPHSQSLTQSFQEGDRVLVALDIKVVHGLGRKVAVRAAGLLQGARGSGYLEEQLT